MHEQILTLNSDGENNNPSNKITEADIRALIEKGRELRENAIERVGNYGNPLNPEEAITYEAAGLRVERAAIDFARSLNVDIDPLL